MKTRRSVLENATCLFIFTIASLFVSHAAVAQIVLTSNSFDAFLNGEYTVTFSESVDTLNIIPLFEKKGADQIWDFTTLDYEYTITDEGSIVTFLSVEGTPGEGDEHFEMATHVSRSVGFLEQPFTNYSFNILNGEEYLSLGSISLDPEDPEQRERVIYSRPVEVYFKFPVTYESTWQYDYEQQLIFGAFNSTEEYSYNVVVDGWGELVTTSGTFNVLRITKTEERDLDFATLKTFEVDFVTADGFPIASLYATNDLFSEETEYLVSSLLASLNVFSTNTSNPREITTDLPDRVTLHQNYPNPFNPSTVITFDLAETATVSLDIYTITGIQVMPVISDRSQQAGRHSVSVDASGLASGVYIYQLRTGSQLLTRKMTLIK